VRPDWAVIVAYSLLAFVSILNLNGIATMAFGIERVFSAMYLIVTGFIVLRLWHRRIPLSSPLKYYLWFMGLYIAFGSAGTEKPEILFQRVQTAAASAAITLAAYMASHELFKMFGVKRVAIQLTILLTVAASTVFLTPYFADVLYVHFDNRAWTIDGRASGFFANPNEAGIAACLAIAFALGTIDLVSSTRLTLALWSLTLLSTVVSVMSFSRAAIAIVFAVFVLYTLRLARRGGKAAMRIIAGATVLFAGGWFLLSGWRSFDWTPNQARRLGTIERLLSGNASEGFDDSRLLLAKGGVEHWLKSPLLGHGIGDGDSLTELGGLGSHNTYLLILGDAGIVPFIAFMGMVMAYGMRTRSAANCAMSIIPTYFGVVFLLAALSSHNILHHRNINMITGVAMALLYVAEKSRSRAIVQTTALGRESYP
jgi:hypothetical protein